MQMFKNGNGVLAEVLEKPFKLERDLQSLVEKNLKRLMELVLVKSEFVIRNGRIDTLAYDEQNKAFVIIEYKRDKNYSVIDQGFMYLSLMLENKADFIVEYNERFGKTMKRDEVDWSQSRVVFVAPSFSDVQIQSANFKDLPIDLWEIGQFEDGIVLVRQVQKSRSAPNFKSIATRNPEIKQIVEEIKVVSEDEHTAYAGESIAELYQKFRSAILNLTDGIVVKPQKIYVAFKKKTNIVDIELQKNALKIWINASLGRLNDAKGLAKDVSKIGHYGNGDYEIKVTDDSELEYIMSLAKQVVIMQQTVE